MGRKTGAGADPRAGLTLVEVLLAAAILGVGLTMLLTAASRCLAVMRMSKDYQVAQWTLNLGELEFPVIATNELEDMQVEGHTFENGFTFSREVEEEDEDEDGLHVVRTRVTWAGRSRELAEEVVHYVYRKPEEGGVSTAPRSGGSAAPAPVTP